MLDKLSVIVVAFRTDAELFDRCLDSIRTSAGRANVPHEIVVVDNSADDSMEQFRDRADRWIDPNENLGFGRACNLGVQQASGSVILFLNPDASIDDDALAALMAAVRRRPSALHCGWLSNAGVTQVDAFMLWWTSTGRLVRRRRYRREIDAASKNGPVPVEKVSGGALFGSDALLSRLGPFDDRFFLYGEDVDISVRASRDGIALLAHPDVPVTHLASSSMATHSKIVEAARADAAIRLNSYHLPRALALATRLEFLAITVLGLLLRGGGSSRSTAARRARLAQIRRWGLKVDAPRFSAADHG